MINNKKGTKLRDEKVNNFVKMSDSLENEIEHLHQNDNVKHAF